MSDNRNRDSLEKVTTDDFSSGGLLNRQQFNEFYREVQENAELLSMVRTETVDANKTQIDKIGVGERLRELRNEDTQGSTESVNTDRVDIDTVKGGLDWEVTRETVEDNIEGESIDQTIMQLMAQQFAVDTQELAIVGDESDTGFVAQNDGWLTIAQNEGMPTYAHTDDSGNAQPIDKHLFHNAIQTIDKKYLREDPMFLMSRSQLQEFKFDLTGRETAAGDTLLLADEDANPFGYDLMAPAMWPDDTALFTHPDNLIYAVQRDVSLRSLFESDEIAERDLHSRHFLTVRDDFAIEDVNAGVLVTDIEVPSP